MLGLSHWLFISPPFSSPSQKCFAGVFVLPLQNFMLGFFFLGAFLEIPISPLFHFFVVGIVFFCCHTHLPHFRETSEISFIHFIHFYVIKLNTTQRQYLRRSLLTRMYIIWNSSHCSSDRAHTRKTSQPALRHQRPL